MQRTSFTVFALAAVTFTFLFTTSCSKSNNDSSSAGVSATVGGKSVSVSQSVGILYQSVNYWDILGVSVSAKDSAALDVNVGYPVVLNQKVSSDTNYDVYIAYFSTASQADYYAYSGTGTAFVTVTSLDSVNHKIAGTFSGTLYSANGSSDSVIVTNGKFNSAYTVQ